ncbi:MAG: isopentenyl phosphate kinase [Haloferacaceae archaeon]
MTVVLKLGGSLITEKSRPETVDDRALGTAADAVARAVRDGRELVLVHGAGSFGHHHADAHGATVSTGVRDAGAVMDIHGAMTTLNRAVLSRLQDRGVDALPVHPLSVGARDAAGDLRLPLAAVRAMLGEGFLPVLHGDGVAHAGEGVTILSGDEVVVRLARGLDADRVGTCSTVPGVLDASGAVIDRIERFDDAADALGGSDATDVTGGMAGKVRALLDLDAPAHVFGPDDLAAFLAGEDAGTRIG